MEERKSSRLPIHCPIVFMGDHMVGKGTVTDLSISGCGVESTTLLRKGAQLALSVNMPDEKDPMDINLASVRWSLGGKFGLEFVRIGSRERARITKLVKTST